MATIAPTSEIYLLKAPIESDNLNHLNFSSLNAQVSYFTSLPKKTFDRYTYVRKDNQIRVEGEAEELMRYNYMMYKNTSYGNKWIFAFIVNVKYLNDNVALITFKTDVFNTWYFDVTFKPSYVEREHTNNDAIGANVLAEDTSEGEYIVNGGTEIQILGQNTGYYIAVQCADAPIEIKDYLKSTPRVYGGLMSGAWTFLIDGNDATSNQNFINLIRWFDYDAKTEAIISMYLLPKWFAPNVVMASLESSSAAGYGCDLAALPASLSAAHTDLTTVSINTTIDGYTPKNNKLFTYPFNYLKVSNHAGSDTTFRWEEFTTSDHHAEFYVYSIPNQGVDSRLIPRYYKNSSNSIFAYYDYGLTGGKLPMISWQSDYYLNWRATNGLNQAAHMGEYVKQTYENGFSTKGINDLNNWNAMEKAEMSGYAGGKALTALGEVGVGVIENDFAAMSGLGNWISSLAADLKGAGFKAFMTPNTVEGCANIGDLNFSCQMNSFGVQKMSIKAEQARLIDQFFSMFGYKTLKVKTPNINGRLNWNYVKTTQANITGDIPQVDMQELKAIFNKGVTIWHNPQTFLDYTQNNGIVS